MKNGKHRHPLLAGPAAGRPRSVFSRIRFQRRVSSRALGAFTRSFAVMVEARLPLIVALQVAGEGCGHDELRQVVSRVGDAVEAGAGLSDSMAAYPRIFSRLYLQFVRAGEAAGVLGAMLLRLAGYLEQTTVLQRKVRLALVYPGAILGVASAAVVFMLTTIVPAFATLYIRFDAALPAPTRLVLSVSQVLADYALALVFACGACIAGVKALLRHPRVALVRDRLLLRLPLLGSLLQKSMAAHFCRTLGSLLGGGVVLVEALDLLTATAGNLFVRQQVDAVGRSVREGERLHRAVHCSGLFPDLVVQFIAAGEQTAALDRFLLQAAAYLEQEVQAALDGLTALIEPVLIVLVGLLLGGLLAAMYLPVFNLVEVIG